MKKMKWKFKDWILFVFFGFVSIYFLKDSLLISFNSIKKSLFKNQTEVVDFTVRKNLNKILNSFYHNGTFYSCKYDNKSYYEGFGFTDDIDSLYMKSDPVMKYTINDEIIFIDDGEKVGVKFSDLFHRRFFQHNYILERKDENFIIKSNTWTTPWGFKNFEEKNIDHLKENGDLNWEVVTTVDPQHWDYKVKKDTNWGNFPSVTFKDDILKVNFYIQDIYDFYKCTEFEMISNSKKKELVKNFLDGFSRFESQKERWERFKNKFKRYDF